MKNQKNLKVKRLLKYAIFIIIIFLLSFYISYKFDIGGQFVSVVSEASTTTTTTTLKSNFKFITVESVNTTPTTYSTVTSTITTTSKTTVTVKYSGGGGGGEVRTTTTTVPKPVAKIIINEIMYNPVGSDVSNQWIEIYNNDTFDCDISDWKIFESNTNHRLTLQQGSMIIPSRTYAIMADNATNFLINHPNFNGTIIESSFSLSNDGEYITLKDYSLNVVDSVIYNSSYGGNGNNRTLERVENDWCESLVDGGTPGFANSVLSCVITTTTSTTTTSTTTTCYTTTTSTTTTSTSITTTSTTPYSTTTTTIECTTTTTIPTIANHVVISEFLVDSSSSESAFEFVELYNPTDQIVNITDWDIAYKSANGISWGKIADINGSIQVYGFFLIGGNAIVPTPDIIDTSLGFSKTGGHIALRNDTNYIIDKVGYGNAIDSENQACLNPPTDKSMERKPGYLNSTAGNGWDSDNNLEDFILRDLPEPQNSSFFEIPY